VYFGWRAEGTMTIKSNNYRLQRQEQLKQKIKKEARIRKCNEAKYEYM
jgi:hypothetical protein